jgi:hypothetical protein
MASVALAIDVIKQFGNALGNVVLHRHRFREWLACQDRYCSRKGREDRRRVQAHAI